MKYCWSCGAELRGTNPQFCSECGIKLDDGKPQPTCTVSKSGHVNVTVSNAFREAQRLYQIEEYNLALTYIDDAIRDNPQNTNYYNLKASILEQLGRYNESAQALDDSLKIKENLGARYQMAYALAAVKDKNAISLFKDAESSYQDNDEYYANLAGLYYMFEDYPKVISHADKSISLNSKSSLGWFYRGCVYAYKEEFKKAINSLEESFKYLDNSSVELSAAYFFRTYVFLIMMNLNLDHNDQDIFPMLLQAASDMKKGYEIFSSNFSQNNQYYFVNEGLDLVRNALNDLVQHNYFGIDFHTRFGMDVARSIQNLTDEYVKIRNEDTVVLKMKGDIFGRLGFHDKAVEYFDLVLKTKDPDFRVLGYKGRSLIELGRLQEAENCLKQMYIFLEDEISRDPRNIYLIREKAVTLAQLGRKRDAFKCYDEILRIDPSAPFVEQDRQNIMRF